MLPKLIKDSTLAVDGIGYVGKCRNLVPPKLTRKMEEYLAGGMAGPIEIDLHNEKLEMEWELSEHSPEVLRHYGVCDHAGVGVRINAAAEADTSDCATDAIEIISRGRWREIDQGSWKLGETPNMKVMMACSYFKYSVNGIALIEIDNANYKFIVNGVDRLAKRKRALKL